MALLKGINLQEKTNIYLGDCLNLLKTMPDSVVDLVVSSPPYCMGKSYEDPKDDLNTFIEKHELLFPELFRVLKPGGSLCWQVGYHVKNGIVTPLDFLVHKIIEESSFRDREDRLILRNRIMWTFGHGLNSTTRFSGRHEAILWYTKGQEYEFNLDCVRVPQKYPGKRHYKGDKKGMFSGNPLGKNPSDVWEVPNVKANHVEKTEHPCQFPVAIPARLILALTEQDDLVLDPFAGSGTTGVAAVQLSRRFIGAEISSSYCKIMTDRISKAIAGSLSTRPDIPAMQPDCRSKVAQFPEHFAVGGENG